MLKSLILPCISATKKPTVYLVIAEHKYKIPSPSGAKEFNQQEQDRLKNQIFNYY